VYGDVIQSISEILLTDPNACEDDDAALAAMGGCAGAIAAFAGVGGCDFVFGGVPISETCPVSCDNCPDVPVPGCMDENAFNFDSNANNPDNSCEYPVFELDWAYDNTDQDATIAISTVTGLETNDFTEMVIGAFYGNSFLSDTVYSGLNCASSYDATTSFASMTVYADEVYTTEKDGFESVI
jgi:hypothetical protein